MISALILLVAATIRSSPDLGTAEGRCSTTEPGPAILITAVGLKDRTGSLRAEIYPPDQADFLADDNLLVSAGKTFRRAITPVPAAGPVKLCIRVPAPGVYALMLAHDRDGRPKFNVWRDGIGFAGNPRLGFSAPPVTAARIVVNAGVTPTTIVLNYRYGLLGFRPEK